MRHTIALTILSLVMACAGDDADWPQEPWDAGMTAELLRRVAEDQAVREQMVAAIRERGTPDSATVAKVAAVDSSNVLWLGAAVASYGWPDRAVVGDSGATAAFLLVQHADRDTAFQARVLPMLEAAYHRGEASGQHLALLSDRLATARGELQVYGTQAVMRDGRMVIGPIRDSSNVDARRAAMGLPPLDEYLRVLDSVYVGRRERP